MNQFLMTAKFHYNPNSNQNYILIEGGRFSKQTQMNNGSVHGGLCLFHGNIQYSMRYLSPREISEVFRQLSVWINSANQDEIPYIFREMFYEFKEGMENAGVKI